jgi:hypothetical protein
LEKVQTEATRIVTGLTSYASLDSIYYETGWEKLTVRQIFSRYCLLSLNFNFLKIFNCFEALSIMVLICLVHLQSQLKITPRCLWVFTVWISVLLKSKVKLFCWLLALKKYLENIYITFIRPILEYGSEVWDNCGAVNSDRLEKVQTEAARIVTGLTSYASLDSIIVKLDGKS